MRDGIFDRVKKMAKIREVVERFGGVSFNRDKFISCPFHGERTPSLSVKDSKNYYHCFGCGAHGSPIDFVAKIRGIEPLEAAKEIARFYRIDDGSGGTDKSVKKRFISAETVQSNLPPCSDMQKTRDEAATRDIKIRHEHYIRWCISNAGKTDYFAKRGFTDETVKRFFLGYDEKRDGIVIPYSRRLEYQIIRLLHAPDPKRPYRKPNADEWGEQPIYNIEAVDKSEIVFVVESQLCAISIMQCGGAAVALGGVGCVNQFVREVNGRNVKCVFVASLDNDNAGQEAQKTLICELKKAGMRSIAYNIAGDKKDPNELLTADADKLIANIRTAENAARAVPEGFCFDASEDVVKLSGFGGIESAPPLLFSPPKDEQTRALLLREIKDPQDVFTPEYIDALRYAQTHLAAEYAAFRARAKAAKVMLRDLDAVLKASKKEGKDSGENDADRLNFDGIDLHGAVKPRRWQISLKYGVWRTVSGDMGDRRIMACPDAAVITARLISRDNDAENLELAFFKDGRWRRIIAPRTLVYSKNGILSLGDTGLHVTSETAKELVSYLSDYEITNKAVIPVKRSTYRVGWVGDAEFYPFKIDSEIVFDDCRSAVIYGNLKEKGDYGEWREVVIALRKNPFARFVVSAAFASPLLVKMGVRPFVVHLWHNSASGKSAVLKAAISAWGNPLRLMGNGFTTIVGIEQLLGSINHLPCGIDEKQAADESKTPLPRLIYMIGEGAGKIGLSRER